MIYSKEFYRNFYLNDEKGPHGLTFADCMDYKARDLEKRHDFFQWVFPTDVESSYNKAAPTYDETIREFLCDKQSIINLYQFWDYLQELPEWPNPTDHNNLRLSRILRSLWLQGLKEEAYWLYNELIDIHVKTNDLTKNNVDHFRSALFQKQFFVTGDGERMMKAQEVLKVVLPDHKLTFIASGEVHELLDVKQPVLKVDEWNTHLRLTALTLPGSISSIHPDDATALTEYFLFYRYWY